MSITQIPEITRLVQPSLACFVAQPFGLTLGDVGDEATHDAVLRAVLHEAEQPHAAGTIVPLPFQWDGDLRRRQILKKGH